MIGFAIVDVARFHVGNLLMTCRAQHKRVDCAFLARLAKRAIAQGGDGLSTNLHFSRRNRSAQQILEEMGFSPSEESAAHVSPRLEDLAERDMVGTIDRTRFPRHEALARALAG